MHKALMLLRKIPKGKVATYGGLAKACKTSPRAVGAIMRSNKHPDIYPCYKVVKSTGEIGGYAGCVKGKKIDEKIARLRKDGIKMNNGKIDLKKYLHRF